MTVLSLVQQCHPIQERWILGANSRMGIFGFRSFGDVKLKGLVGSPIWLGQDSEKWPKCFWIGLRLGVMY